MLNVEEPTTTLPAVCCAEIMFPDTVITAPDTGTSGEAGDGLAVASGVVCPLITTALAEVTNEYAVPCSVTAEPPGAKVRLPIP